MPTIELKTIIHSDIQTCFDLARSIDLHKISTAKTNEEAINGRTSGLIGLNEFVTWRAKHFGITQELTSKITVFNSPFHFRDEQVKGAFRFIVHDHIFETNGDAVIMKDVFKFRSPFGLLGQIFDKIILTAYLTKLLNDRNSIIKEYAESSEWQAVLK
ncbi:MAG: SRPBCC family protein [Bacteroidota bacterium]